MKYNNAESSPSEQKEFRQHLRNHATPSEAILWQYLKNKATGYKFRRQHGLGPYIMDFYCPALRLCIEIDGNVHDNYGNYNYDEQRTAFLSSNGIKVMRFRNEEILSDAQHVIDRILAFIKENKT